jgi:hypothetical protein
MSRMYDAILERGQLRWSNGGPPQDRPLRVRVVVLDETPEERAERGRRMAEILQKLAARNPFAEIKDPVAWQREIRKDRPLPGREG